MPMVKYWQTDEAIAAIITRNKEGATIMRMGEGDKREKHDFPGFPRGYLLFGNYKGRGYGPLSVLKHEIKNQIFNESWKELEEGKGRQEIIDGVKGRLKNIFAITKDLEYELLPPEKMFSGVREIWRAMSVLEERHPESKENIEWLKKTLTFIMSEDDAYRFRAFWIVSIFNPSKWYFKLFGNPVKDFQIALEELENAEVLGDMKERIRLLRRILLLLLEDKKIKGLFLELCKEMKWSRLKLSKGDKFHYRAKYVKVDWDKFEY